MGLQRRLKLQALLESILGSNRVYFQPPPSIKLVYPCIVYQRDSLYSRFADNEPYAMRKRYMVTVIDQDPDSDIPDRVAKLPLSSFSRHFASDNLNHDVYTLYF